MIEKLFILLLNMKRIHKKQKKILKIEDILERSEDSVKGR